MIYMKELPNGNRVNVTEEEYSLERLKKEFLPIISAGIVRIYRLNKPHSGPAPARLNYGGRLLKNGVPRRGI